MRNSGSGAGAGDTPISSSDITALNTKILADTTSIAGTLSASIASTVELDISGYAGAVIQIGDGMNAALPGTLHFQSTLDNTNWIPIVGCDVLALDGQVPTSADFERTWVFNVAGFKKIRVRSDGGVGGAGIAVNIRAAKSPTLMYQLLAITFVSAAVTSTVLAADASTATLQTAGNATLAAIDGHVDGIETLITSTNTKLDTLHADVDGLEGFVDGLEGFVDGVETLLTSTNTKLDTLHADVDGLEGFVDGLETLVTATNTKLDTLHADVDGLETIETAGNASLSSLDTKASTANTSLASIDAGTPAALGQTTMSASMPVTMASDQTLFTGEASADVQVLRFIYREMRAMRMAMVALACESGKNKDSDFDPDLMSDAI